MKLKVFFFVLVSLGVLVWFFGLIYDLRLNLFTFKYFMYFYSCVSV